MEPYFKIAIPPPLDIMTTLALAVIGGLAIVFTKSEALTAVALDGKKCVAWMIVTAIAAPGVPGGVITSSLGALASILFLTPEQCSMLMTVYLAMDGVGSACSVGGHGAIVLAVDRITRK